MAINIRLNPFDMFFDNDGTALENGYIYVGVAGDDPEVNPQVCYWDSNGTITAQQPIRTLAGYPVRNGAPGIIFSGTSYSIRVRNSAGSQVFYAASVTPNTIQLASVADTIAQTPGLALDTGNISYQAFAASQVTTGTFNVNRIPNIDASKVTTGIFSAARLPQGTEAAIGALQLASVAEAEAGTNTTKAVTPAGLAGAISAGGITASSYAQNGYEKNANGGIDQWGSFYPDSHSGEGTISVTFPLAFPTACLNVVATCVGDGTAGDDMWVQVISWTSTGCTLYYQATSSGNTGHGYTWRAKGH